VGNGFKKGKNRRAIATPEEKEASGGRTSPSTDLGTRQSPVKRTMGEEGTNIDPGRKVTRASQKDNSPTLGNTLTSNRGRKAHTSAAKLKVGEKWRRGVGEKKGGAEKKGGIPHPR